MVETREGLDIWDKELHVAVDIGDDTLVSFDTRDRYSSAAFFGDNSYAIEDDDSDDSDDSVESGEGLGARQWWRDQRYPGIDKAMVLAIANAWGMDLDEVLGDSMKIYNDVTVERGIEGGDDTSDLFLSWSMDRKLSAPSSTQIDE